MFNEEYKIVGNPDILLFLEDVNAFQGVELKSITPNDFPDLARPKPEHVIQSLFYWWLMHALGYRLTTTWSIVYLNKGHSFHGNPYKEFVVDMPSQLARLDMFLEEALALKQFRAGGILPPRVRCTTTDTPAGSTTVCVEEATSGRRFRTRSDAHSVITLVALRFPVRPRRRPAKHRRGVDSRRAASMIHRG